MDPEREAHEIHETLDRLGAVGRRGLASARERVTEMILEHVQGKPLPTREQIHYARFGLRAEEAKA